MIGRVFGLPGSGKTTLLAMWALQAVKSKKYKNVYANVHLKIDGVAYVPFDMFGSYELRDCIYFVDEATVNCGDRDWKGFGKNKIQYLMEHRHHNCDVIFFSQEADGMDKKIRSITDRVYYVYKGFWTKGFVSKVVRVPYTICWPNGKNDGGENAGRILMGYVKPPLLHRIFAKRVFRKKIYKYFDSWECVRLPELPEEVRPYGVTACETESARGTPRTDVGRSGAKRGYPLVRSRSC